jgi:hypothetical protein
MAFEHNGTIYEVDETGFPTGRILSPCGREWQLPREDAAADFLTA